MRNSKLLNTLYVLLLFEHQAKIIAIDAMEPLEYCCTFILVNHVISFANFLLDDACLDGPATHGTSLSSSFIIQFSYSAGYERKYVLAYLTIWVRQDA